MVGIISPEMIKQMSANSGSTDGNGIGDWLMKLWPEWASKQGLEPPMGNSYNGAPVPAQTATATPNPAPALPPPSADNNPVLPPVPNVPQMPNGPAGMSFNGAPGQVQQISAQEEAVAQKAADDSMGKALSGIQAMQPQGIQNPGAPGVPGTRGVDANLLKIIESLTQPQGPRQMKTFLG